MELALPLRDFQSVDELAQGHHGHRLEIELEDRGVHLVDEGHRLGLVVAVVNRALVLRFEQSMIPNKNGVCWIPHHIRLGLEHEGPSVGLEYLGMPQHPLQDKLLVPANFKRRLLDQFFGLNFDVLTLLFKLLLEHIRLVLHFLFLIEHVNEQPSIKADQTFE